MKKRFNKWLNKQSDTIILIIVILIILIGCAAGMYLSYLVIKSDFPEWVKFWLLR